MQKYSPVYVVVTVNLHLHELDHSSGELTSLADNESIPTIRCSTCSEWHHRPCVNISENKDQSFVCRYCKVQTMPNPIVLSPLIFLIIWNITFASQGCLHHYGPKSKDDMSNSALAGTFLLPVLNICICSSMMSIQNLSGLPLYLLWKIGDSRVW